MAICKQSCVLSMHENSDKFYEFYQAEKSLVEPNQGNAGLNGFAIGGIRKKNLMNLNSRINKQRTDMGSEI